MKCKYFDFCKRSQNDSVTCTETGGLFTMDRYCGYYYKLMEEESKYKKK